MGIIREPDGVDFVVEPITEEDSIALELAVLESKKRLKMEERKLQKKTNSKPAMKRKTKILA